MAKRAPKRFTRMPRGWISRPRKPSFFAGRRQIEAAKVVRNAIPAIADGRRNHRRPAESGGKLAYAAAGSSGLMALADALELPGTFGIQRDRIAILVAGGDEAFRTLAGGPEDDTEEAAAAVASRHRKRRLPDRHCRGPPAGSHALCACAPGGRESRRGGATTIARPTDRGSALLRRHSADRDPASTRRGSDRRLDAHGRRHREDRAQHAVDTDRDHLGHVHDGYMVNPLPTTSSLRRDRAVVVSGRRESDARRRERRRRSKTAILLAAGAANADAAEKNC